MNKKGRLSLIKTLLILYMAITVSGGLQTVNAGGKQINSINTDITYLNRMMLPPGSTVTVTLSDVSKMDVKSVELAKQTVNAEGAPPYPLTLSYDADMIEDRMRYSLRAVIENEGQLLYTSTEHIDPFGSPATDPIQIIVSPVQPKTDVTKTAQSLNGTEWTLSSLNGNPAGLGAGDKELHIRFSNDGSAVQGFSGCNTYNGSFTSSGNELQIGPLAATMKMCIDSTVMELEQTFHKALDDVKRFGLTGNELTLMDAQNNPLVTLKSK